MALEFLFPMPSKNGWHSLRYTHSFFVQTNAKNGKTTNDFLFNACTLVPTVFRRHKKMEFKFHFYFSFFCGLVKWNSISISIFCFLSTCDIEKWIWISFFVFRFRRTLKRGFEFRFLFFVFSSLWKTDLNFVFLCFVFASLGKRISISFFVFALLVIEKQIGVFCMNLKSGLIHQSFETPPPPLPLRGWPG